MHFVSLIALLGRFELFSPATFSLQPLLILSHLFTSLSRYAEAKDTAINSAGLNKIQMWIFTIYLSLTICN